MERSGPDDARDDAWDPEDGQGARPDDWSDTAPPGAGRGFDGRGFDGRGFDGRGFEMFDDLEDLEDDPDAYPVAPLPRHERTWRHPSEMGEAAWVRTEPPVAIGRGLLVTSGAIGSALGVAVLYLMLPTGSGTPSAGPSATSSFAMDRAAVVTLADDRTTSSFVSEPASTIAWTDSPGLTLPAPDTPSTVLVMADPEQDTAPVSVAVAIEGSPYMVTTANALASLDVDGAGVHLLGPGSPDEVSPLGAELLTVEGDLAFLSPAAGTGRIEVVSFARIATAEPGQLVTVLADEPAVVPYPSGGARADVAASDDPSGLEGPDELTALDELDVLGVLDAGTIVEGTPVIDADGALVALCTVVIDADGAYVDMIPLAPGPDDGLAGLDGRGGEETTETSDPAAPTPATSVDPTAPEATAPTTSSSSGSSGSNGSPSVSSTPSTGTTSGAWIGLRFDGAPSSAPLTVTGVVAGSPALAAGVMVGERLLAIDGVDVTTVDEVIAAVRRRQPGDILRLTLASAASPSSSASNGSNGSNGSTGSVAPSVTAAGTPTTTSTTSPASTVTSAVSTTTTVATGNGSTGSNGSNGSNGTVATTPTTAPTSGSSSSGGTAGSPAGTRTVSVVLGALAPTV